MDSRPHEDFLPAGTTEAQHKAVDVDLDAHDKVLDARLLLGGLEHVLLGEGSAAAGREAASSPADRRRSIVSVVVRLSRVLSGTNRYPGQKHVARILHASLSARRLDMTEARTARGAVEAVATSFADVLHAPGPVPELADKLALYSWLVGNWEIAVTTLLEDGTSHTGRGEIHAGWVLQGRAIQDVWMIPRLQDRKPGIQELPGAGNWYGTTLRIYDRKLDAWRILWSDPATGFFTQQTGRARGRDIVQEGPDPRGGTMRWTFAEIESDSFRWSAERSSDGMSWRREVDIRARRALPPA